MQPRRIEILPSFEAALKDLSPDLQEKVEEALVKFVDRSADNALRPEPKRGFDGVWSFRVSKGYRAFYVKERDFEGARYHLFYVGHHDDYRMVRKRVPRITISIRSNRKGAA